MPDPHRKSTNFLLKTYEILQVNSIPFRMTTMLIESLGTPKGLDSSSATPNNLLKQSYQSTSNIKTCIHLFDNEICMVLTNVVVIKHIVIINILSSNATICRRMFYVSENIVLIQRKVEHKSGKIREIDGKLGSALSIECESDSNNKYQHSGSVSQINVIDHEHYHDHNHGHDDHSNSHKDESPSHSFQDNTHTLYDKIGKLMRINQMLLTEQMINLKMLANEMHRPNNAFTQTVNLYAEIQCKIVTALEEKTKKLLTIDCGENIDTRSSIVFQVEKAPTNVSIGTEVTV